LNALQNFTLKATQKPGVPPQLIETLVEDLRRNGVSLGQIEYPFALTLREVNEAIRQAAENLGPAEDEESNASRRETLNLRRRVEKLQAFLGERVAEFKSNTATPRVFDMGTIMHLELKKEIERLNESARKAGN
jgi:hypothetical protein